MVKTLLAVGATVSAGAIRPESILKLDEDKSESVRWNLRTRLPQDFPILATGMETLKNNLFLLSGGKFELDIDFQFMNCSDAQILKDVRTGSIDVVYSAPSRWKFDIPGVRHFTGLPFGLKKEEFRNWLSADGGTLWKNTYSDFGLVPYICGSCGESTGGWFNTDPANLTDLNGLDIYAPSAAGDVLKYLGVESSISSGLELADALKQSSVDGGVWLGPAHDIHMNLNRIAKYVVPRAWHSPSGNMELTVNKESLQTLSPRQRLAWDLAVTLADTSITDSWQAADKNAMEKISSYASVSKREFSPQVVSQLKAATKDFRDNLRGFNSSELEIDDSYRQFETNYA